MHGARLKIAYVCLGTSLQHGYFWTFCSSSLVHIKVSERSLMFLKQLVMGSRLGPHNFYLPLLTLFERIPPSWNVSVTSFNVFFLYFAGCGYVSPPPPPTIVPYLELHPLSDVWYCSFVIILTVLRFSRIYTRSIILGPEWDNSRPIGRHFMTL